MFLIDNHFLFFFSVQWEDDAPVLTPLNMNIPIQHDIQYNDTASHWKVSIIDGLKAREQGVAGYLQLYQSC